MSRFSDAWRALTRSAPGVAFSDTQVLEAAGGLLAGAVPWGVPPQRGERELLVAQRKVPWLHVVTGKIAGTVAGTPWQLFVPTRGGKPAKALHLGIGDRRQRAASREIFATRVANGIYLAKQASSGQGQAQGVEEVINHPLLDLLHQPNPIMSGAAFWTLVQLYLDLPGEFFGVIERNAAGMPIQIWPVPGYWVFRTPYYGSPFFHFNFGTWYVDIHERDVIWLRKLRAENPYGRGAGTGEALGDEIDTEAYALKTQKAQFYNQGVPAGIAILEGMDSVAFKRAKEMFLETVAGFWNAGKTWFVNSKADFKPLAQKFADMQLMELRKASRDTIVQTYGVPPEVVGILSNSNKATITAAQYLYAEHCIVPRLEFLRSELQQRLVREFDERILIDYISPTPDDQNFELEVGKAFPYSRSLNEMRRLQNLPPRPGWDDVFPPIPAPKPPPDGGAGPDPMAGKALPARRRLTKEDSDKLGRVLSKLEADDLSNRTSPVTDEETRKWMTDTHATLGTVVDWKLVNPKIAKRIEQQAGDKIGGVNDTTKDALRETLSEGLDAGEDVRQLRQRVNDVFDDAEGYRAEAIARTECASASSWASVESFRDSGVVDGKEWIATPDDRTRPDHSALDGVKVGVDESFRFDGGGSTDSPGNSGILKEDINERCAVAAVLSDKGGGRMIVGRTFRAKRLTKTMRLAEWKAYDAALIPWETKFRNALVEGFKAQRVAVETALERI